VIAAIAMSTSSESMIASIWRPRSIAMSTPVSTISRSTSRWSGSRRRSSAGP
jgi:hypothetical protein